MNALVTRSLVVTTCLCVMASAALADEPAEIVKKVVQDWRSRQERTKTIRYVVEGEGFYPKSRLDHLNIPDLEVTKPTEDHRYPIKLTLILDVANGLVRKERTAETPWLEGGNYFGTSETYVYNQDGLRKYNSANQYEVEEIMILRDEFRHVLGVFLTPTDYALFMAHGLVPTRSRFIDPKRLTEHAPIDDFAFQTRTVLRETPCWVVQTKPPTDDPTGHIHKFWVDPERQSAILRWQLLWKGRLYNQLDIAYQSTPHGWLPSEWKSEEYTVQGRLGRSEKLRVKEVTVNGVLEPGLFEIPLKPGLRVRDQRTGVTSVVAPDGKSLVPTEMPLGPPASRSSTLWRVLAWSLALGLALLVGWLLVGRLRSRWFPRPEQSESP